MGSRMMPNPSHGDHPADHLTAPSHFALGDPASFLGVQFGSDPAVLPHEPSSILNPWLPYSSNHASSSPAPQPLEYYQYHPPRVSNDQDAWNPLQVTGVPMSRASLNLQPGEKPYPINEYIDRRCSTGQYSDPSESDSQYNGLPSGDSGYGSRSCTTRSIAASSFAVDSACSPHLTSHEREPDEKGSIFELGPSGYGTLAPKTEYLSLPGPDDMKCHYPNCNWKGKCPSDKRKHEARHRKMFRCDEPNCSRKEGFGTINDLARHKKCVHKQEPERGPKILYMCFGHNCPRRQKRWPRLDNFRQHLSRMHKDEDADGLLRRSQEWYEATALKLHDLPVPVDDQIPQEVSTPQTQLSSESDCMLGDLEQNPCSLALSNGSVFRLPANESIDSNFEGIVEEQSTGNEPTGPAVVASHSVKFPTLNALNLTPTLDQTPPTSQLDSLRKDHVEEFITEAATNMLSALTRMMNSNQRRNIQPPYDGNNLSNPTAELCGPKKEILQRILRAALDRLSGNTESPADSGLKVPEPEPDKRGWIKCEFCSKRTRLRCEMKWPARKHQKRHERPYGCTFKRCDKTFGSKADWKRHENSQHYHLQSWRCTLQDPMQGDLPCARLFYRSEIYMQHLQKYHHVDDEEVQNAMYKNRIDLNGQSRFWCGFCKEIIPLRSQGLAAWNERFNHIDVQHFRRGERIGDWLLPSGHLTKEREWEEARKGSTACSRGDQSPSFACDNTENDNDDCSDSSSDIDYRDESMVLNQDEDIRQTLDQSLNEASLLPQSPELQGSRKRKVDTPDPTVAHCWPYSADVPLAKRRFSVDDSILQARDPRMAHLVTYGCPVEDTQPSDRALVDSHALPPYRESPYHIRRMH
ncbi:putative C2H2 finger domain protein [Aspergillus clavatus NRRL 1]|uniref:C2H2 type zinc finger domain protein n=1 Tax=Aspergillus clavatus (strain ATCC 1007 / CBS 513.65 / DSM 816 / NCTC 3887 / NRRL 1 / QM 1276 / 107) TaxID=344612 RepID=A1C3W8_ASPCL|nr:C2H2 type zinc finger domain protein [Aspergillus clavatus NRRL 1]EAW15108.1 C2H2 type zinc finger domain protein [Aspergillus clavatus NRRL 1]